MFQILLSPLIQKELHDIKNYWNNHPICSSLKSNRESRLAGRRGVLYSVRDSYIDYFLKYNNQNILLVGEESCWDENNTVYIRSDAFYEPYVLLMG